MNTKFILLNGPQECGKGVLEGYLTHHYNIRNYCCKQALHKLVMDLFLVSESRYWEIYEDRGLKEKPLPEFKISWDKALGLWNLYPKMALQHDGDMGCNLSIRQAMIYVSEVVVKPNFGKDYFGRARAHKVSEDMSLPGSFIGVDDSTGFVEELPPLIDLLGQENILLLRIHREGFDYGSDSRGYIPDGVIDTTVDVWNNAPKGINPQFPLVDGEWKDYLQYCHKVIGEWL